MKTELVVGTVLRAIKKHVATKTDELSFEVGDLIEIDLVSPDSSDLIYHGVNRSWGPSNGKRGFFPVSHIQVEQKTAKTVVEKVEITKPAPLKRPESLVADVGSIYTVIFDHDPSRSDELKLNVGDKVKILESPIGGWWNGQIGSESGWFPCSVVEFFSKPVDRQGNKVEAYRSSHSLGAIKIASSISSVVKDESGHNTDAESTSEKPVKKPWLSKVIKKVSVRSRSSSVNIGASSSSIGSPESVRDRSPSIDNTHQRRSSAESERDDSERSSATHSPILSKLVSRQPSILSPARLHEDFLLTDPNDDGSMSEHEVVHSRKPSMYRQNSTYSPSTAVNPDAPDLAMLNRKTIYKKDVTWQDFVDPARLASLTPKEKQKQTAIWELIYTERDYVRDLKMVFECPMTERKILPVKNVEKVFTNIDDLYTVNKDFLEYLDGRLMSQGVIENLGDLFLKMGEKFICYTMYCSNQTQAIAKLQQHITSNKVFKQFLDDIYRTNVTRQLDLASFLLKPIQRICKYPLLIKEILKHTDPSCSDFLQLQEGQEKIQAIIHIVNEGARQLEGTRKILDIQNSFTEKLNFVVPNRYLVREDDFPLMIGGSQKKEKARKVFLFNDLLLLARKDWRDKLHMIEKASLRDCRVFDVQADDTQDTQEFYFELEIGLDDGSRDTLVSNRSQYIFICRTAEIKKGWLDAYKILTQLKVKHKYLSDVTRATVAVESNATALADVSDEDDDELSKAKKLREDRAVKEQNFKDNEENGRVQTLEAKIKELQIRNYDLESSALVHSDTDRRNVAKIAEQSEDLFQIRQAVSATESLVKMRDATIDKIRKELEQRSRKNEESQSAEVDVLQRRVEEVIILQQHQQRNGEKKLADYKVLAEREKAEYEAQVRHLMAQIETSVTLQRRDTQEKLNLMKVQKSENSTVSVALCQSRIKQLEEDQTVMLEEQLRKDVVLKEKTTAFGKLEITHQILCNASADLKTQYESLSNHNKATKQELEMLLNEKSGNDVTKEIKSRELQAAYAQETKKSLLYRKDLEAIQLELTSSKNDMYAIILEKTDHIYALETGMADVTKRCDVLDSDIVETQDKLKEELGRKKRVADALTLSQGTVKSLELHIKKLVQDGVDYSEHIALLGLVSTKHLAQIVDARIQIDAVESKRREEVAVQAAKVDQVLNENQRLKSKCNEVIIKLQETQGDLTRLKEIEINVVAMEPRSRQATTSAEDSSFQRLMESEVKERMDKLQFELLNLTQSLSKASSDHAGDAYNDIEGITAEYQHIIQELYKKTSKKLAKERQVNQDRKHERYQQYQAHVSSLTLDSVVKEEQAKARLEKSQDKIESINQKMHALSEKHAGANDKIKTMVKHLAFKSTQLNRAKSINRTTSKREAERQVEMEIRFSNVCGKKLTSWQELEIVFIDHVSEIKKLKTQFDAKRIKCRELEFLCRTNIEHSKVASDIIRDSQEFAKQQADKLRAEHSQIQRDLTTRNEELALKMQSDTSRLIQEIDDLTLQSKNLEATIRYQKVDVGKRDDNLAALQKRVNEKDRTIADISKALDSQRTQTESAHERLGHEFDIRQFCDSELKALRKEFFNTKTILDRKNEYVKELKECIINLRNEADEFLTPG